jgi:hypothetical protein
MGARALGKLAVHDADNAAAIAAAGGNHMLARILAHPVAPPRLRDAAAEALATLGAYSIDAESDEGGPELFVCDEYDH